MTKDQQLKDFMERLIRAFTKHHKQIEFETQTHGANVFVAVRVHRDDHPRMVGSKGSHIRALNVIATLWGIVNGVTARFSLQEPNTGEKKPLVDFKAARKWDSAPVVQLFGDTMRAIYPSANFEVVNLGDATNILLKPAIREDLLSCVHFIFHAIGKNQGRMIYVINDGQA